MNPRRVKRRRPVTGRRERRDQLERDTRAQWFVGGESPPPDSGRVRLAFARRHARQGLERLRVERSEAGPFGVDDVIELGRASEPHAVEEVTRVQLGYFCDVPRAGGSVELPRVAYDHVGIEPQGRCPNHYVSRCDVAAHGVKDLANRMSGVLIRTFGPEQRRRLVALHTPDAGRHEQREERDALRRDRPRRAVGASDVPAA